jgi:hypothetical protein
MRQRYPDPASIDEKLVVDRIGVACGDGDDLRLINAMDLLFCPAVSGGEVLEHE